MSVIYNQTTINARLTDVINNIDGGGGNALIKFYDGGANILSTMQLSRPCGTVSAGVLTFSGTPWVDPSAAASGIAVSAIIADSNGTTVVSGLTVGTGSTGFDIILTPTANITAGQTVAVGPATITGR